MSILTPTRDTNPEATTPLTRIPILDGLRLVAALMVVAYHYIGLGDAWDAKRPHGFGWPVYWASEYGFLGVELFFLISGFVICMSSLNRRLGDFFIARVVRLYPAYWFAIVATTIVVTILPAVRKPLGIRDTLVNLSMLQIPLHVTDVDGVYWTLWAEMRFYLLFAIVVALGVTYRRVVAFCALWTVADIVTVDHGGALLHMIFLPYQAPYFIAGAAFFLIHRYGSNAMLWAIVGLQFVLAVHYLGVDGRIKNKFGYVPTWFSVVLISLFFLVLALIAMRKMQVQWRFLTVMGTLTYPVYLLHQHIGWALLNRFQHDAPAPVLALGVLLLILGLSYLVHRFIERPVAARMRTVLRTAVGAGAPRRIPLDAPRRRRTPATSVAAAAGATMTDLPAQRDRATPPGGDASPEPDRPASPRDPVVSPQRDRVRRQERPAGRREQAHPPSVADQPGTSAPAGPPTAPVKIAAPVSAPPASRSQGGEASSAPAGAGDDTVEITRLPGHGPDITGQSMTGTSYPTPRRPRTER